MLTRMLFVSLVKGFLRGFHRWLFSVPFPLFNLTVNFKWERLEGSSNSDLSAARIRCHLRDILSRRLSAQHLSLFAFHPVRWPVLRGLPISAPLGCSDISPRFPSRGAAGCRPRTFAMATPPPLRYTDARAAARDREDGGDRVGGVSASGLAG